MNLTFRLAVEGDGDKVFLWRNNETVRRASLDSGEITLDEHRDWFRSSLIDTSRSMLIAEDAGTPVGVLRFDVVGDVAEISIFLDPDRLGRGYGTEMLRKGADWVRQNLSGIATLRAKVKSDNPMSSRTFEKSGFVEVWRVYERNI